MIPTTDHDEGLPPLVVGDVAHLARVLLDRRCWALLLPGDQIAELLLGIDVEGASHDP